MALSPTLLVACLSIVAMGAASIGFIATANATLQLTSEPEMRGRVMALYAMAFLGTTPIGAPLVGAIAQWTDPRVALLAGSASAVAAAGVLLWHHQSAQRSAGAGEGDEEARVDRGPRGRRGRDEPGPSGLTGVDQPPGAFGSFGSPSTLSPTMLRWISAVPPQMVSEREKKKDACRVLTG